MRVHHLALRTRDLGRLETFYAEVLGLGVTRRNGDVSVWLDAGGTIVMLERAETDEPGIDDRSKELVAFAITPEARTTFERALDERGIAIEARTRFTLYFRDPDGRRVGVSHYPDEG